MSVSAPEKPQIHDLYDITGITHAEEREMELRARNEVIGAPVAVPELPEDEKVRHRAGVFIGACAVANECEVDFGAENMRPNESLYDAIRKAKEGDMTARKMVETNVKTDVVERTIKSGHVGKKVTLQVDAAGVIQQHGQSMESVQANSLRFAANNPQMRRRIEAETVNSFRLKQLYEAGKLEDASFVVFSCAADDMRQAEMKDAGFFTETMSCAIQMTSVKNGEMSVESAFIAGVKQPGAHNNQRVDIETVIAIAKKLNVDFSGMTATEILATPILVPNAMLKNGVIDLVQMWDEHHGDTFFGEIREKQDYLQYRHKCYEREETLQPKVELITNELIDSAHRIHNRVGAVQHLSALSGKHMIEQAVFDVAINPAVFGDMAAQQIYEARQYMELGDIEKGLALTMKAIENDQSSSCPGGLSRSTEDNPSTKQSDAETCTFISRQCPKCGQKNVLTTVTKNRISGSCRCSVYKK